MPPRNSGGIPQVSTRFSLSMEMSRLTRDGTAEPVSRDQILRREERGQRNINFPYSADHKEDWQPYPVGPYYSSCYNIMTIHTYMHTYIHKYILHTCWEDQTKRTKKRYLLIATKELIIMGGGGAKLPIHQWTTAAQD